MKLNEAIRKIRSGLTPTNPKVSLDSIFISDSRTSLPDDLPEKVFKDFICNGIGLTTLRGCPVYVKGGFNASNNYLTSLEHGPITVDKGFAITGNSLISLEHGPTSKNPIAYNCADNKLETLKGCTPYTEYFSCARNKDLDSLKYGPIEAVTYVCSKTGITSFEGVAKRIEDSLYTADCRNLKSLKGIAKHVLSVKKDIILTGSLIKEGGLGLLRVKHLKSIIYNSRNDFNLVVEIFNKYLNNKKGDACTSSEILKCKAEIERDYPHLKQFAVE